MKEPEYSRAYARQQKKPPQATTKTQCSQKKEKSKALSWVLWVILANYQTWGGAMEPPTYSWAWSNIHEAQDLWLRSEVEDHWGDWTFKSVESDANSR